jgi:hypothetical protein
MQTRRTPGTPPDRSKNARDTHTVVLWRPDIRVAPGAILASLQGTWHSAAGGGETRTRSERSRLDAALDAYRTGRGVVALPDMPTIPIPTHTTERGLR